MGLLGWRRLWLLGAAAALLLADCSGGSSSSNHSLKIFLAGVSEPGQVLFIAGGFLDDQLITAYDSEEKRFLPRLSWREKLVKENPQPWNSQTMILRVWEFEFREILSTVRHVSNHSRGLHTLQLRIGCELIAGGQKGGHFQLAYDGRDFIAFDVETLTWTAATAAAQSITKRWEADPDVFHRLMAFLNETCMEWLQKNLRYGKESLQRREPPVVKVTRKDSHDGLETLFCRVHGFYPKKIDVTWRKDGEVRQEDTFRGVVSPNVDGTYYTWLSINIDPKDRSRFRCHVDHDGLLEPLDVALVEAASVPLGVVVGVVLMVVVLLLLLTGIVSYIRGGKRPFGSLLSKRPPPAHPASLEADLGSSSSVLPERRCGGKTGASGSGIDTMEDFLTVLWDASGTSFPGDVQPQPG